MTVSPTARCEVDQRVYNLSCALCAPGRHREAGDYVSEGTTR